jgi:YfiH family protein
MLHNNSRFQLVFCNACDGFFPADVLKNIPYPLDASPHDVFRKLAKKVKLTSLVLLKQVHGIHGVCVDNETLPRLLCAPRSEGDFLVTAISGVGIGVLTADCLPFAIYDPVNHAAAMVHAGWRGSVERIGAATLTMMRDRFGTRSDQVEIFLGPCAHACCYQVSEDFARNLATFSCAEKVVQCRESKIFFDLPLFNRLQLEEAGVRHEAIHSDYSKCTICNKHFCSYRREGVASCRQLSLIVLT